ncbi:hypothetical protein QYF61_003602 [Mycteria americana]|uniref:Rna-directed dna polymerase from mobile element jockey-like n=1 Tax=Mycteria americana TaxID=33587 RepID=A0AAN7RXI0_MYCAM|nr:hypothetical protein QYF61_003602 [Mycteria americana]
MRCSFMGLCSNALCIQHLDLGPVLFSIFVNDLDDGTECALSFADDTKQGGVDDTLDGCAAFQGDVDWLENWANRNVMPFNKRECKALHLGRNSPIHQHRLGHPAGK